MFHKLEGNSFYLTNGQRYKKNSLFQSVLQFLKKNRAKSASKMNCVGELASRNLSAFLSHALLMLKKNRSAGFWAARVSYFLIVVKLS